MYVQQPSVRLLGPDCYVYALAFNPDDMQMLNVIEIENRLPMRLHSAAPKRRLEFHAGRYAAAEAIRLAGGPADAEIGMGDDRSPMWPTGYVGSISHAANFAAAYAADARHYRSLGYDAETLMTRDIALEVSREVANLTELQVLGQLSLESAVTLIFSSKESIFKAHAPLLEVFFGFESFRLVHHNDVSRKLRFCLQVDLNSEFRRGYKIDVFYQLGDLTHTATCIRTDGAS